MREILFRGKRVDTGEWVYGSFVPDLLEVFEGDILHFINTYRNVNHEWHCTVEFVDGAFVCRYIESEGHLGEYNYFTSWNVPLVQWDVIGNIHDNPELLQEISR